MDDDLEFIQRLGETLERVSHNLDEESRQAKALSQHIASFDKAVATLDTIRTALASFGQSASRIDAEITALSGSLNAFSKASDSHIKAFEHTIEQAHDAATAMDRATRRQITTVVLIWVGIVALIVALVGGFAFYEGKSTGLDIGQAQASAQSFEQGRQQGITEGTTQANKDIREAALWAKTPNGQRALAMDRNDDLNAVLQCSRPGWEKQKQKDGTFMCYPWAKDHEKPDDAQQYGWAIPANP